MSRHFAAIFIWEVSGLLLVSLAMTGWYGVRLFFHHRKGEIIDDPACFAGHVAWVRVTFWVTLCGVLGIEAIRIMFRLPYDAFFFQYHLPVLVPYAGLYIVARWWLDGDRHPAVHRIVAPLAIFFGTLTVATGSILNWRLLMR